jgi:hypothetical protein
MELESPKELLQEEQDAAKKTQSHDKLISKIEKQQQMSKG